ncbi:MAG: hypothetical protein NUV69_05690 [Candidatus Curtissbacteria bacterium]|nr:hypothetical protein [Candidatus Curtissbacteria bacterium]
MPRYVKFAIPLIILALFLFAYFRISRNDAPEISQQEQSPNTQIASQDEALKNALNLYAQKKEAGVDFSNGPCLGIIAEGWVLDIAHNPRQKLDDREENQCKDFLEGSATHFIELDPEGKLLKIN